MQSIAQFAKRRKLILRLVASAIGLTLLVMAGSYWRGRDDAGKRVSPVLPVAKNVQQQASGYTFTRSDEGRQVFTIHATRTVAFKEGGTTVLEGVQVEVFGKDGARRDLLRTSQCDYNSQTGDLFSSGSVEIELNAAPSGKQPGPLARSVMLVTSQLYFRQQGAVVESDQPVQFRYGSVSGSSLGMSYWTREGRLALKKGVQVELQSKSEGDRPISLTASRAQFDKEKGEVTLSGPVEVTQGERRASASSGTLSLDDRHRLTRAVFEGPVRASEGKSMWADAGRLTAEMDPESESLRRVVAENDFGFGSRQPSSVSGMNGVRMEVKFAGKPARPATGVASGRIFAQQEVMSGTEAPGAAGISPGKFPSSRRALMTEEIQFSFRDSGRALKDAATTSSARLVMVPSDPRAGQRDVTARRLLMSFDALGRLETTRGEGGTNIWFAPGKDAPAGSAGQNSASDRLVATLDPATETVQRVEQSGNYRFFDGDRQASADRASYETATETLTLTGKPQVWDAEMRARAAKIVIDMAGGRAEGLGKVESTHTGGSSRGEPTNVLADRVIADRRSQTVRYEGHVRAWRGADVVESAALEILRAERRVSSGSEVLTSHLQPTAAVGDTPEKSLNAHERPVLRRPTGSGGPATIRADHLEYTDQGRKAAYRGHVRMRTESTTLEADRLDAYFKESGKGSELDRAIADGSVKVTQPGRHATSRHAEYFSADGKIVLTGGPPTLHDSEKGFTSGQSLTFYSRDDRLVVSGGDESATISRHRIGQ